MKIAAALTGRDLSALSTPPRYMAIAVVDWSGAILRLLVNVLETALRKTLSVNHTRPAFARHRIVVSAVYASRF
jgi:hypothetical protein